MAHLSGYKLIGKIAEGGMATVFKAIQISLDRPVAIKVLSKKLADNSEVLRRFNRESRIIAKLANPHIIHVIDRGLTSKDMPYFVMEYVEGTDLAQAIKQNCLDFNRKLELVIQICKALSYAHKNGVIHRDIKPANVLIDHENNARMLDFGIAQFYIDEDVDNTELTLPGIIMGTIPYMSPEQQLAACEVTLLSDIYSLGVLMYELFTGIKPIGSFKAPAELDPSIPVQLESLIIQCMEQKPEKRPSSADDIVAQLLKLLQGAHLHTEQRKRASMIGITRIEDKFALLDVIRENKHGAVYLYEERVSHSLMAIKRRLPNSEGFTEAKMLTSLKHQNIINIMGASRNDKAFIIVMEYMSGGSLHDRLVKPHDLSSFIRIARQISSGLSFAHKNRILHGNLRPSNILFSKDGIAKITDLGLNEHYRHKPELVNWYNLYNEQKAIQTDIFAAGIIFYQMLTAELPDLTDIHIEKNDQFQQLPLELQEVIHKMTARNPDNRYLSFDHIINALDSVSATCINTVDNALTEAGTTVYIEKCQPDEKEPDSSRKSSYTKSLVLLLVLYGVAITYLSYTGEFKTYIDHFIQFAHELPLYWKETAQPLIDKLVEHLNDLKP